MRNNLTKREISWVSTDELNGRFCRLMQLGETAPAGIITYADMMETLWIEDELHRRLIVAVGHDFYPPEGKPKPTMAKLRTGSEHMLAEMLKTIPKSTPKVVQPMVQTEGKFRFKVAIINSLGSTVKTLNLHVDDKDEAEAVARETIKQLGLKKATFKVG